MGLLLLLLLLLPLFLDFVHLLEIFFGRRILFGAKGFLSLQWSCFRLGYLIYFESASHGLVHHDFSWSLNFLQRIQSYIIEIAGAIEIPLLVSHNLLEKVIAASFTLLLFQ